MTLHKSLSRIPLVESAVAALIVLYPFLVILVRSGTNGCFVALLIIAILHILRTPAKYAGAARDGTFYWFSAAMASLVIATFISQLYHWNFKVAPYDGPSRFLLCIPVYLYLRQVPARYLTVIQYGFVAGALVTLVIAFFKPEGFRLRWYFIDSIHFGEIALVLGALASMSINWDRSDSYGVIALKIVALVAGLNASVLSAARGGWLAIPVVFAVWARLVSKQFSRAALAFGAVGLILAMVGSYTFSASVRDRINTLASDLSTLDTNPNTSNGLRWQIYVAGLHTYIQNPIFGIGPDQFANLAAELGDEGYLTHRGVEVARMEIHNEILVHAIALGTFGLAAILLIYFVPLYFFLRAARRPDRIPQRAGVLGACFVVSFVVFGLSVETFDLKTPATFYALTAAVLLAIATNTAGAEDKVLPS